MRQTILPHSWIGFVACLATVMLMSACTTVESTLVQLDQSVHFVTSAGTDVVVKPGRYRVEPAGDSDIQLLLEQGAAPVVLQAESVSNLSSPPDASAQTAMVMIFEPDAYDVVLQRRGRQALVAHGSVSGIESRALVPSSPRQLAYEAKGAVDLVGCIAHFMQNVCSDTYYFGGSSHDCTWTKRYYFKITNFGNATAGPSYARFSNSSTTTFPLHKVGSISPGLTWTYYGSNWAAPGGWTAQDMGPKPWTYSVDVQNAVAEVNEGNNTSGECPESPSESKAIEHPSTKATK